MTEEKDDFAEALDILLAHTKSKEKERQKPVKRRPLSALIQSLPTPFAVKKKP